MARDKTQSQAGKPKNELDEEACERLGEARRQKAEFDQDLREGYWFAAPHRSRSVSSQNRDTKTKPNDAELLNTSLAFELAGDFSTVIMNTFLPEAQPWAKRLPGMLIPAEAIKQVTEAAEEGDELIFKAIGGSNFYAECGKGFTPDLALGTVGMWCDQPSAMDPMRFQAVPIRELEIAVGPDGTVDDRFVVRQTKFRYVKAILKGVTLSAAIEKKIRDNPNDDCTVARGFWKIYGEDQEAWQYTAMIDEEGVDRRKLVGVGSCPLIAARFNPAAEWAWGVGPLIQALPDLRVVDDLAVKKMKMVGRMLDPPTTYPDDAETNFEDGVEDGALYPVRPGSQEAIKAIYQLPQQDPAIFYTQDLEARIKRLFFLDYPNQPGKTPATATQWIDEMMMAQRRIGTPGLAFWEEFCRGIFLRVQHLCEKHGSIKPLQVNGKTVSLIPYNPAQQSYEMQLIAQFSRFAQLAAAMFPEEWKMVTDGGKTMENLARIMAVNRVWATRKPEDVQAAIGQLQQLTQGTAPGAPAIPSTPQPAPEAGPGAPDPKFSVAA